MYIPEEKAGCFIHTHCQKYQYTLILFTEHNTDFLESEYVVIYIFVRRLIFKAIRTTRMK